MLSSSPSSAYVCATLPTAKDWRRYDRTNHEPESEENAYKAIFRARAIDALKQAEAAAKLTHPRVKGTVREILIGNLLRPLLPADIGIGTGQIIEAKTGRLSKQQDIILYDRSIVPPISFDVSHAVVRIEAVLYTIEVKSLLINAELVKAHESAKELKSFGYLTGQFVVSGKEIPHPVRHPNCVVIALGTDLSVDGSNNDAKRYVEIHEGEGLQLSAICVVGRGYWYEWKWVSLKNALEGDEVLGVISGIMNTYRDIAASRRWPRLGNYLMEPSSISMDMVPGPDKAAIKVVCAKCGGEAMTVAR
jgi:Domain of unknown function (DUF6602)